MTLVQIAQWMKALAIKPDSDLSLDSWESPTWWKETTESNKLSFDLHICADTTQNNWKRTSLKDCEARAGDVARLVEYSSQSCLSPGFRSVRSALELGWAEPACNPSTVRSYSLLLHRRFWASLGCIKRKDGGKHHTNLPNHVSLIIVVCGGKKLFRNV